MPVLRRRNLSCFYCGTRSSETWKGRPQQWLCKRCESVNYLDENGEICDPPALETPQASVKYAHPVSRAGSPESGYGTDETLFCRQCISNQQLYLQALASYLPPPDDPSYPQFEASYDEYKRKLEERYPQVCADCAPRVRQRIRQAGYAAKTDHLRRMMERTKFGNKPRRDFSWTWRSMLLLLGGFAWWMSISSQLLWHALGAWWGLTLRESTAFFAPTVKNCIQHSLKEHAIEEQCFQLVTPWATKAILAGIPLAWWHPTLRERMMVTGGRIVGLWDYFKLQFLTIVVRLAAWWCLQSQWTLSFTERAFGAAHLTVALFIFTVTVVSLRMVKIDFTPNFSFSQTIEPDFPTPTKPSANPRLPEAVSSVINTPRQHFPISKLAPTPSSAYTDFKSDAASDSEASTDLDVENHMDWTPTRPSSTFTPYKSHAISPINFHTPATTQRSPFYGTIPEAPISQAHRLRNPPQRPVFTKAPLDKQNDFFSKMMSSRPGGSGVPGEPESNRSSRINMEFQPAKLNLNEQPAETGLEAMFDSVFSMRDEPPEVRAAQDQSVQASHGTNWNILFVGGLAFSAIASVGVWAYGNWHGAPFGSTATS